MKTRQDAFYTCTRVLPNFFFKISSLNAVFHYVKDHCWKLVVSNVFFTITCLSTTCLISRENAHQIDAVIQNNNAIRMYKLLLTLLQCPASNFKMESLDEDRVIE